MTSGSGTPSFDVVVIGGSQAGLAVGYHLAKRGLRFVILDAGSEPGQVWRSRWDSLTLFTPAQYSGLPGLAFPLPKDTYPSKDDVARYLQSYVSALDLPVRLNAKVTSLTQRDGAYAVETADEEFTASHVVVATGPFQVPFVPPIAGDLDEAVFQIHSADYRNPAQLPEGRVLVVGGGNSGFQIAEELAATRNVDLAVGKRVQSLPQRLLGRDLFWWLSGIGFCCGAARRLRGRERARRRRDRLGDGVSLRLLLDRSPNHQRREGRHHPSARGCRRVRRAFHRAHLAAHPGVGAHRVRGRRRCLHRESYRLVARGPRRTGRDGFRANVGGPDGDGGGSGVRDAHR